MLRCERLALRLDTPHSHDFAVSRFAGEPSTVARESMLDTSRREAWFPDQCRARAAASACNNPRVNRRIDATAARQDPRRAPYLSSVRPGGQSLGRTARHGGCCGSWAWDAPVKVERPGHLAPLRPDVEFARPAFVTDVRFDPSASYHEQMCVASRVPAANAIRRPSGEYTGKHERRPLLDQRSARAARQRVSEPAPRCVSHCEEQRTTIRRNHRSRSSPGPVVTGVGGPPDVETRHKIHAASSCGGEHEPLPVRSPRRSAAFFEVRREPTRPRRLPTGHPVIAVAPLLTRNTAIRLAVG
jgi:hypothetical protein